MSEERKKIDLEPKTMEEKKMREAFEQWYHSREFVPHGVMIMNLCYLGFKQGAEYIKQHMKKLDLNAIADEIIRVLYPTYEQAIPGMKNAIIQKKQRIRQILEWHIKSGEEKGMVEEEEKRIGE